MKAIAVFSESRRLRLIDHEEPRISKPNQVKLGIGEVGVCGTDKEIARFEYGTPPPGSDYLIIGHEAFGEVAEVGPAVDDLEVGDLVVPMVRRPCPHRNCLACRSGHQDFCSTGDFTERGIKARHGFMAEYVVDEAQYMIRVPEELREVAVLVEPASIAAKALAEAVKIMRRLPWVNLETLSNRGYGTHHAVILGAGTVGLLGALALKNVGFDTYVYDRAPAPNPKSALVESIGAHYVSELSVTEFGHLLGNVELVYEATGASQLAFRALKLLGPNSLFIFTGVPARGVTSRVDTDSIMRNAVLNNQVIIGTVNAGKDAFHTTIRELGQIHKRWPLVLPALIAARHPVGGYRDLLLGQLGGIKQVISFNPVPASPASLARAGADG